MALNLQRLFQWGKTPKPPYDLSDQPFGRPNDGDDLDAELDQLYANDADLTENKLSRDGTQAMTGNLDMDGNRVQNLPLPVNGAEPARKQELDALSSSLSNQDATFLKLDGSRAMTGNLDMGGNKILGLQSVTNTIQVNQASNGTAKFGVYTNDSNMLLLARQDGSAQLAVREGENILKRRYDASGNYIGTRIVVDEQNSPGAYGLQFGYNTISPGFNELSDLAVTGLDSGTWLVIVNGGFEPGSIYIREGGASGPIQGRSESDSLIFIEALASYHGVSFAINMAGITKGTVSAIITGTSFYIDLEGFASREHVSWMKIG